jgi:hypothetical protein
MTAYLTLIRGSRLAVRDSRIRGPGRDPLSAVRDPENRRLIILMDREIPDPGAQRTADRAKRLVSYRYVTLSAL